MFTVLSESPSICTIPSSHVRCDYQHMGLQSLNMARVGNFWFDPNARFNVESLDNGWIMLSNSDVRLYAVGRTIEEAKADLAETLGDIQEDYVLCDESDLHESGIELRRWFMENVRTLQAGSSVSDRISPSRCYRRC